MYNPEDMKYELIRRSYSNQWDMAAGYFLGRKLMKLPVLSCLGAITGGMTSTPALGMLIRTTGSDEGAASYASTYPFALLCVVLVSQFMILIS